MDPEIRGAVLVFVELVLAHWKGTISPLYKQLLLLWPDGTAQKW